MCYSFDNYLGGFLDSILLRSSTYETSELPSIYLAQILLLLQ